MVMMEFDFKIRVFFWRDKIFEKGYVDVFFFFFKKF